MKLLRIIVSVGVISVVAATEVVAFPKTAAAYHETNKSDVKRDLENDWVVLYGKEFSQEEYLKLSAAVAKDAKNVAASKGGSTTAFFQDFARSSLQQIRSEAETKSPQMVDKLTKELTVDKLISAIQGSFNGKQVELSVAGVKLQVGRATYDTAECVKIFGFKKCIGTPKTYQPYIRFRVSDQSGPSESTSSGGDSDLSKPSPSNEDMDVNDN